MIRNKSDLADCIQTVLERHGGDHPPIRDLALEIAGAIEQAASPTFKCVACKADIPEEDIMVDGDYHYHAKGPFGPGFYVSCGPVKEKT